MDDEQDSFSLEGRMLLAMPSLGDKRFDRAVILICAHDEENGAMGLVVNHCLPKVDFREVLNELTIPSDIEVNLADVMVPVFMGGPVEGTRGFLLHSNDFRQKDTIDIDEIFRVTGTVEVLQDVARGGGPQERLFILGYAGWTPGQLEQEIKNNAWLVSEPDPDIIFHPQYSEKWGLAVQKMGIDPGMLSSQSGNA